MGPVCVKVSAGTAFERGNGNDVHATLLITKVGILAVHDLGLSTCPVSQFNNRRKFLPLQP